MKFIILLYILISSFFVSACGKNEADRQTVSEINEQEERTLAVEVPEFNADSAYFFIEKQVSFGPRVPNTRGHRACAEYLVKTLERFTDHVSVQTANVQAFDGTRLNIKNIKASINPEKERKILLCAHWDTRPFADFDPDPDRREEPIPGANDGASGVGVILEIARILAENEPNIGIEIILFDAEDYGAPHFHDDYHHTSKDSWALGAQYWAKNHDKTEYFADYGILLDMVGARNSVFLQEGYSMRFAPSIVNKVWETAASIGYSNYFQFRRTSRITDDHYYVNKYAEIPTINIIDHDERREMGFGDYWHTHKDDMDIIDKSTLKAVGQTVLTVIFNE
jgi:hypothetical protein